MAAGVGAGLKGALVKSGPLQNYKNHGGAAGRYLAGKGADVVCSFSHSADQKLYNNITVFMPAGLSDYVKRDYRMLSKQQFVAKMDSNHCRQVVPVDEQPSQLLALRDCADTAWTSTACSCKTACGWPWWLLQRT